MNETIKNELRKKVLIPSILLYFLIHIDNLNLNKTLIIDAGAMHFLSMDKVFFKNLEKKFGKINLVYLNNTIEQVISNLFHKNKDHYSFLERGFKKEIYEIFEKSFGVKIPNDLKEATKFIEAKEEYKIFIKKYINNILTSSKKELDVFIDNIRKKETKLNLYKIDINKNDSIEKIINNIKNLKIINLKMNSNDRQIIKKNQKQYFLI